MQEIRECILTLYQFFCAAAALFGVYFAVISAGVFLKKKKEPSVKKQMRFAVLAAARNEESCIAALVESIRHQDYPKELVDVYVIVNNCTDNTADAALAAGAQVIYASAAVGSKGQALHEAFSALMRTGKYDAYCVFDADNEASPRFLAEMNRALQGDVRVAKSRIFAKNASESWVAACYEMFFCNANVFLNAARSNLGLSARLIGTGFAVRHDLMEDLGGWNTKTLTEDAEFYAMLSERGECIGFVPGAIAYDEEPLTFRESLVQRRRWMSGIMEVGRRKCGRLMKNGRDFLAFDALVQLLFAWMQAAMIPMFLLWFLAEPAGALAELPRIAAKFYAATLLVGGSALVMERRLTRATAGALFLYPVFIFSFLPLQTLALVRPNKTWKPIRHTGVRCAAQSR